MLTKIVNGVEVSCSPSEESEIVAEWLSCKPVNPLVLQAKNELEVSDLVAIRCIKAGVAYPSEWSSRDSSLRAIVKGSDTTSTMLPPKPPYPVGT